VEMEGGGGDEGWWSWRWREGRGGDGGAEELGLEGGGGGDGGGRSWGVGGWRTEGRVLGLGGVTQKADGWRSVMAVVNGCGG